jgi:hypothetical protein
MKLRRAALIVSALLLGLGGTTGVASPASASTRLGGIDMQAACNEQYPGQGRIAKVVTYNVYGWKCVTGVVPVAPGDISTWRQCQVQYGWNQGVYSGYTNYSNPYSWSCYR